MNRSHIFPCAFHSAGGGGELILFFVCISIQKNLNNIEITQSETERDC